MTALTWLIKAALFFVLFAFALNNQGPVTLHFFFGTQWQGPVVLVVLATFVLGLLTGILVMVPVWLRARRKAQAAQSLSGTADNGLPVPPPL